MTVSYTQRVSAINREIKRLKAERKEDSALMGALRYKRKAALESIKKLEEAKASIIKQEVDARIDARIAARRAA